MIDVRLLTGLAALPCGALFRFADGGKEDGLLPLRRPAAANPGMRRGDRASENLREARGTQGKAIVPSHGPMVTRKEKHAMRKSPLAIKYAMRKLCAWLPRNIASANSAAKTSLSSLKTRASAMNAKTTTPLSRVANSTIPTCKLGTMKSGNGPAAGESNRRGSIPRQTQLHQ